MLSMSVHGSSGDLPAGEAGFGKAMQGLTNWVLLIEGAACPGQSSKSVLSSTIIGTAGCEEQAACVLNNSTNSVSVNRITICFVSACSACMWQQTETAKQHRF